MTNEIVATGMFSTRLVRELKGCPLSVLMLLALSSTPMSNEWLSQMSGYSDKPLANALAMLSSVEYQLIRKVRGGWIVNTVKQLPLEEEPESRENSDSEIKETLKSRKNSESRKISVSTTTALIDLNINNNHAVAAGRKNSDFLPPGKFDLNLEACKVAGIGEPAASRLSALEHVNPQFIYDHMSRLKRPRQGTGLAIKRIEGNEEVPFDPRYDGVVTVGGSYSKGEFAELMCGGTEE